MPQARLRRALPGQPVAVREKVAGTRNRGCPHSAPDEPPVRLRLHLPTTQEYLLLHRLYLRVRVFFSNCHDHVAAGLDQAVQRAPVLHVGQAQRMAAKRACIATRVRLGTVRAVCTAWRRPHQGRQAEQPVTNCGIVKSPLADMGAAAAAQVMARVTSTGDVLLPSLNAALPPLPPQPPPPHHSCCATTCTKFFAILVFGIFLPIRIFLRLSHAHNCHKPARHTHGPRSSVFRIASLPPHTPRSHARLWGPPLQLLTFITRARVC